MLATLNNPAQSFLDQLRFTCYDIKINPEEGCFGVGADLFVAGTELIYDSSFMEELQSAYQDRFPDDPPVEPIRLLEHFVIFMQAVAAMTGPYQRRSTPYYRNTKPR